MIVAPHEVSSGPDPLDDMHVEKTDKYAQQAAMLFYMHKMQGRRGEG